MPARSVTTFSIASPVRTFQRGSVRTSLPESVLGVSRALPHEKGERMNRGDGDHEQFKERLARSEKAVGMVGRWFRSHGHWVQYPPRSVARTYQERHDHIDCGDLFVRRQISEPWLKMDVKQYGKDFTCREDWPYPGGAQGHLLICSTASFDRADPKPYAYYILNTSGTHAAIVNVGETREHWYIIPA